MAKPSEQMEVKELFGSREGGCHFGSGQRRLTLLKHLICSPGCYLICAEDGISSKVFGDFSQDRPFFLLWEDGRYFNGEEMAKL